MEGSLKAVFESARLLWKLCTSFLPAGGSVAQVCAPLKLPRFHQSSVGDVLIWFRNV